jgi:hypothetical protein
MAIATFSESAGLQRTNHHVCLARGRALLPDARVRPLWANFPSWNTSLLVTGEVCQGATGTDGLYFSFS